MIYCNNVGTKIGVYSNNEIKIDEVKVNNIKIIEIDVNEVEVVKIETQIAKYKVHNLLIKANYRLLDRPQK